jgi:hypothetical protein
VKKRTCTHLNCQFTCYDAHVNILCTDDEQIIYRIAIALPFVTTLMNIPGQPPHYKYVVNEILKRAVE